MRAIVLTAFMPILVIEMIWWEEYNRIVKHNDRVDIDINPLSYIRGTVLIVWIDGEMNFFSVYIDELYDLCIYLERSMA